MLPYNPPVSPNLLSWPALDARLHRAPSLHARPLVRRSHTCQKGSAQYRLTRPAPHQCLDPTSKGCARPAPPPLELPCGQLPVVSLVHAVMRLQAAVPCPCLGCSCSANSMLNVANETSIITCNLQRSCLVTSRFTARHVPPWVKGQCRPSYGQCLAVPFTGLSHMLDHVPAAPANGCVTSLLMGQSAPVPAALSAADQLIRQLQLRERLAHLATYVCTESHA